MKQEELQVHKNTVSKPEIPITTDSKSSRFLKENLIDFLLGFVLGLCFSIYSFYFLSILNSKKIKRVGMFWGCFISFVVILFICFSFAAYTSYKHETFKKNKNHIKNHQRKLVLLSYSQFLFGDQKKIIKKHQQIHAKKHRKLRKIAKKHYRQRITRKKRRGNKVLIV